MCGKEYSVHKILQCSATKLPNGTGVNDVVFVIYLTTLSVYELYGSYWYEE
jgi:hypothetical protein